jgi:hypothetical protein
MNCVEKLRGTVVTLATIAKKVNGAISTTATIPVCCFVTAMGDNLAVKNGVCTFIVGALVIL